MTMPSETRDVAEPARATKPSRSTSQLTPEQRGMAVAALVAFLGITYVGPALTKLGRKPTLKDRLARRMREAQRQADAAGRQVRRRVRPLGGGTIRG